MSPELYLITDQLSAPFQEFPDLLRELAAEHQLDGYTSRQQLLGQGQALLAKGSEARLQPIQDLLTAYDIPSYLFKPTEPEFAPFTLTHLEASETELRLYGRDKQLLIPHGARLLLLLSDLSGNLGESSLRQMTAVQRYQGAGGEIGLSTQRQQRAILQGRPVLDIYLLNDEGRPTSAVRAFPGKFDIQGLGERATLSRVQNLLKLSELVQEYASQSRVDMNFGLSPIPGATIHPGSDEDFDGVKKNLHNLTGYAWLQTDIDRQRKQSAPPGEELPALVSAALLTGQPALAATASLPDTGRDETLDSAGDAAPTPPRRQRTPLISPKLLPPPSSIQRHNLWISPKALTGYAGLGAIPLLLYLIDQHWLTTMLQKGFGSGSITTALAIGLYFWAFQRLKLKRLIENTPTSKIRSIAMGIVEIKGTARRQYALVSPLGNAACVYYRLTRYKRDRKNNLVVSSITSSGQIPFWVEDETGRVTVVPDTARITPRNRLESLDNGGTAFNAFHDSDEKWVEELIYDGALIYVLGEAQLKKSETPKRSERRAEALRQLKQDRNLLAQYDTNADGRIDVEDWQAACDDIDDQLIHQDLTASNKHRRQEDQIMIARPHQSSAPFVIAETPTERSVAEGYHLSMVIMFGAAILATLMSAWLIMQQF